MGCIAVDHVLYGSPGIEWKMATGPSLVGDVVSARLDGLTALALAVI